MDDAPAPELASPGPNLWRDIAAGVTAALVATGVRALLGLDAPGIVPYAFVFPAALAATMIASWRGGALCLLIGISLSWRLFAASRGDLLPATRSDVINVVLLAATGCAIVLIAQLHRAARRRVRDLRIAAAGERERALDAQLRLFDNAISFMAVVSGPDHRITYANRAFRRMLRLGSDIMGRPYLEVRPGAPPAMMEALRGVLRTGQPFAAHDVALTVAPGDVRRVDYVFEPIIGADGQVEAVFIQGQDMTEVAESRQALEESENRLRLAIEAGRIGIWEWRLDTNEMVYSPEARAICGFGHDQAVTYDMVVAITHPEDLPHTSAQAQRALDPALRDTALYEYRIVRPDGQVRWVTARGQAVFETRRGKAVAVRYLGTLIDITERKLVEEAVRDSQQSLALALGAGRMAVWQVDAQGRMTPSPSVNGLIGLPADATPTAEALAPRYLPGELERVRAEAAAARKRGDGYLEVEYAFRAFTGEVRWFNVRAEALTRPDGAPAGAIGVIMDVTERKQAEERLKLLMREVDHRANNLMSVVQSTVALSRAGGAEALRQIILGRVHALARAHQLLSESRWEGASLKRLIDEEMLAFVLGAPRRVRLEGPDVSVTPAAAQAIAMAVHELATNAVKHGALSTSKGRIEVAWRVAETGELTVRWAESGGPSVRPPRRRGFGTKVLARALTGLKGSTDLEWAASGLVCTLRLPLAEAAPLAPARADAPPISAAALQSG